MKCFKKIGDGSIFEYPSPLKNRTVPIFLRGIAGFLLITFTSTQISWTQDYQLNAQKGYEPVEIIGDGSEFKKIEPSLFDAKTSTEFLDGGSPLSPVEEKKTKEELRHYEYERYEFKDALGLFRPEYASAVIVKDLTVENLKELLKLPFETAIIRLKGERVLFTTGNKEEIGILKASQDLLKEADFISHTHVTPDSQSGPSPFDLHHAVRDPLVEYVLTQNGVFAYNQKGLQKGGELYSFEEYLNSLHQAMEASQEKDRQKAAALLNEFIKQMDEYNLSEKAPERTLFRRGENQPPQLNLTDQTISYTQRSLVINLPPKDPDGDPLIYTSQLVMPPTVEELAYNLKNQLGLYYSKAVEDAKYYENYRGKGEKYILGAKGWYFIYPNGEVHKWAGTLQSSPKTETLDASYHLDPRLLTSAPPPASVKAAYNLKNQLGLFYSQAVADAKYYENHRGAGEKYILGAKGWYFIYPNGEVHQWAGTLQSSPLAGTPDPFYHLYPEALLIAKTPSPGLTPPAQLTVEGNKLTISPQQGFLGDFQVKVTARDPLKAEATQTFKVKVQNYAPQLALTDQVLFLPQPNLTLVLPAKDFDGDPLIYTSQLVMPPTVEELAYNLKNQLGLYYSKAVEDAKYYENYRGKGEKYILGAKGWYFIYPNGEVHKWAGTLQSSPKTETLDASYHLDPRLLTSAPPPASVKAAYNLKNQLGLYYSKAVEDAKYYENHRGAGEKYIPGKDGWYFIYPNGEVHKWAGTLATSPLAGIPDPFYHLHPEALLIAKAPSPGLTPPAELTVEGNKLTITPHQGFLGEFQVKVTARDPLKAEATQTFKVKVLEDKIPPQGTIQINQDAPFTNARGILLSLSASDSLSGVDQMSFSTDDVNWTTPETYATSKTFTLPAGDGSKTVYVKYYDKAGNISTFSDTITLDTTPPQVVFTSAVVTGKADYVLTYTADGVEKSRRYLLGEGKHRLLFYEADQVGNGAYYSFEATLDTGGFPEPKALQSSKENVLTATTKEGLTLKYEGGKLISITNGEGFELVSPEFDDQGHLTGGLLKQRDGSESYSKNGKLVFFQEPAGTRYFYKSDGTLDSIVSREGIRTSAAYEKNQEGNTFQTLLTAGKSVSIYDPEGRLLKIFNEDSSRADFNAGILHRYQGVDGQVTNFRHESVPEGTLATRIESHAELPPSLLYDTKAQLLKVILGDGTVIDFSEGLVRSVTGPDGVRKETQFAKDPFGFLTGGKIQFGANQRTFDGSGFLRSVKTEGNQEFSIQGSRIQSFKDEQGNFYEIRKMSQDGKILDAAVTAPDGSRTIYVSGVPIKTELVDGRSLLYKEENLRLYLEDLAIPLPEFKVNSEGTKILFWQGQQISQRPDGTVELLTQEGWRLVYRKGILETVIGPTGLTGRLETTNSTSFLFEDGQGRRYRLKELTIPAQGDTPGASVQYFYSDAGVLVKRLVRVEVNKAAQQESYEHTFDAMNRLLQAHEVTELPATRLKREWNHDFTYSSQGGLQKVELKGSVEIEKSRQKNFDLVAELNASGTPSRVEARLSQKLPFRNLEETEASVWQEPNGLPLFEGSREERFRKILVSTELRFSEKFVLLYRWFQEGTSREPLEILRLVWSALTRFEEEKFLIDSRPLEPGEYDVWGITSVAGTDYGAPLGSISGRGGYPNQEGVLAPHASFLALSVAPKEAIENLQVISRKYTSVAAGKYGFYDSFNLNTGEAAKVFTAHDVAASFVSTVNFLTGGRLRRYLEQDPMMSPALELLRGENFSFLTIPEGWETPAEVSEEDRSFLSSLAEKQWKYFDENVNLTTHFLAPNWVKSEGGTKEAATYSSILDSAFYLLSLMGAVEMGYLASEEAEARAFKTLQSLARLDTWQGLLHNYYRLNLVTPKAVSEKERFISSIDNGWLAAVLVMIRQYFAPPPALPSQDPSTQESEPTVSSMATELLKKMDFSKLLAEDRGQLYVGYDPDQEEYTPSHYGLLNTEIRPTLLVAMAKGDLPSSVWSQTRLVLPDHVLDQAQIPTDGTHYRYLLDPRDSKSTVAFIPSWGGSLSEALMPSLLVDEANLSPLAWGKSSLIYTKLHKHYATGQRAQYEARVARLKEEAVKRIVEEISNPIPNPVLNSIPASLRQNFVIPEDRRVLTFEGEGLAKASPTPNLALYFKEGSPTQLVQENGIRVESLGFDAKGEILSGRVIEPSARTLIYQKGTLVEIQGGVPTSQTRPIRLLMPEGLSYRLSPSSEGWQTAELLQVKGLDGTVYTVKDNRILSLQRPDGTKVMDLEYDSAERAAGGRVIDPDGVVRIFRGGKLIRMETPQGFILEVKDEKIQEVTFPEGRKGKWEELKDPATGEPLIALFDGRSRRAYKTNGKLHAWIFDRALVQEGSKGETLVTTGRGVATITRVDPQGNLLDAQVKLSDSSIYQYENGKLASVSLKDRTVLYFSGNRVVKSVSPDGIEHQFLYTVNGGIIENVEVETRFKDGRIAKEGIVPYLARDYASPETDFLTGRVLTEAVDLAPFLASFSLDPRTPMDFYPATDPDRGRVYRLDSRSAPSAKPAGLFARLGGNDLRSFRFINVSLRRDPLSQAPSSVTVELKGKRNQSIRIDGITETWKDFVIPFDPSLSPLYEVAILLNRDSDAVEPLRVYLDNLTFFAIRYDQDPSLKAALGLALSGLSEISREAKQVPPLNLAARIQSPLLRVEDRLAGDLRTRIEFDRDGQVTRYLRGDGGAVIVAEGKAKSLELNGKATIEQTFDSNSRLVQSLYRPLQNPTDPQQVIQYEYDRIRRIQNQATGEILQTYHYEFDSEGREITVVKDPKTGEEQSFLGAKLIQIKRPDGLVTTFEYDAKGRILRSRAAFQDLEKETFDYTYRDDSVLIRDQSGLIRHYDLEGKLTAYTTPEGFKYAYLYKPGASPPQLERVELVERRLPNGTVHHYQNGSVVSLIQPDGGVLRNLVRNEKGEIVSAEFLDRAGVLHRAEKGFVGELRLPNGEIQKLFPAYLESVWLEKAPDGKTGVSGENTSGIYKYDEQGFLYRFLDRKGFITDYEYFREEGQSVRTAHVQLKKLLAIGGAKVPTQEEIAVTAAGSKTVIALAGKEIESSEGSKILLLVIDPLTGEIQDQAKFNLSKPGEASQMNVYLRLVPEGMFLLGGVSGTQFHFGSDIEQELLDRTFRKFGIKSFLDFGKRGQGNWAFVGRKGTPAGGAYESLTDSQLKAHVSSHEVVGKSIYAVSDGRLVPTALTLPKSLIGKVARAVKPASNLEVFGEAPQGDAALWKKNFNPTFGESGFYRLFPEVSRLPLAGTSLGGEEMRGIARQVLALVPRQKKVAVYFDDRYASSWIDHRQARHLKSRLVELGVTALDADGLRLWLEREGPGAGLVMAQDVLPDTAIFDAAYLENRNTVTRLQKETHEETVRVTKLLTPLQNQKTGLETRNRRIDARLLEIEQALATEPNNAELAKERDLLKAERAAHGVRMADLGSQIQSLTDGLKQYVQTRESQITAARQAMEASKTQTYQKSAKDQIVRQYLERGGTMIWMNDVPFYWIGNPDGTRFAFPSLQGHGGQAYFLGVHPGWMAPPEAAVNIRPVQNGASQNVLADAPEAVSIIQPWPDSIPVEALNWQLSEGPNQALSVSPDIPNQEWKLNYSFSAGGGSAFGGDGGASVQSARVEVDFLRDVTFANSQKLFDLRRQNLVMKVRVTEELAGKPVQARFFARDGSFQTQSGPAFDLSQAKPGDFVTIEYRPDLAFAARDLKTDPGFDPTQIRFLGVEFFTGSSQAFSGEIAFSGIHVEGIREEVRHLYTDKEFEALGIFQPAFKINLPWDEIALWYGLLLDVMEGELQEDLVVVSEVDPEGQVRLEKEAGGRRLRYEGGKIKEVIHAQGKIEKRYHYTSAGELAQVEDLVTREELDRGLAKSRQSLFDRELVLLDLLEEQKGILEERIRRSVAEQRSRLESERSRLESMSRPKKCKRKCKSQFNNAINDGLSQINSALGQLATEEARALGTLNEEIGNARTQVSEGTKQAFRDFEAKEMELKKARLRQEIAPVLAEQFRKYFGRDPSSAEINEWVEKTWPSQAIDFQTLTRALQASEEHQAKIDRKNKILGEITGWMEVYFKRMSDPREMEFHLQSLGLTLADVQFEGEYRVNESRWRVILRWLESQDLHLGDSAYRTLLAFAKAQGITLDERLLASRVILLDLLTGVISATTEGPLELSLESLRHNASLFGVSSFAQKLPSLDSLEKLLSESSSPVIAHINGDHYVLVEGLFTDPETQEKKLRYRDFSIGKEGELLEITQKSFLEIWEGIVLAKTEAPEGQILTSQEARQIQGAFFFLIPIFAAIGSAIAGAVSAVIGAITAIVSAIAGAITAALGAIQGMLAGIVGSIGNALGALGSGLAHLGQGILHGLQFVGGKLLSGFKFIGTKLLEGVKFIGKGIVKGFEFVKSGFLKGFEFVKTGVTRIFSGIKDGIVNGFKFLKQGLSKALDFLNVPKGVGADGVAKFTAKQWAAKILVGGAIGTLAGEGLKAIGVPDTIANLAGAFLSGGITGGIGTATASASTNFFRGGLQMLALQGVSELGRKLDLPPPITQALSLVASTLTGAALDPKLTLSQALKGLAPRLAADLALSGVVALGSKIGLDPRLTALIGVPIRASIGALTGKALGLPGYKDVLGNITSQTLGGLISVGASIGLDAIGAPPVLQSFVPVILGQLASGLGSGSGGSGGGGPPPTTGDSLFKRITDNVVKFGRGLVSTVGNVVSFGAKVLESGVNFVKQGFAKAADFFSGIFSRKTQETLRAQGGGTIENAVLKSAFFEGDKIKVSFAGGEIVWDPTTETLKALEGRESYTFRNPSASGGLFSFEKLAYAEEVQDGVLIQEDFEGNRIKKVGVSKDGISILEIRPLDQETSLGFENLKDLRNAQITIGEAYSVGLKDGEIVSAKVENKGPNPISSFFRALQSLGSSIFSWVSGGLQKLDDFIYDTLIGRSRGPENPDEWGLTKIQEKTGIPVATKEGRMTAKEFLEKIRNNEQFQSNLKQRVGEERFKILVHDDNLKEIERLVSNPDSTQTFVYIGSTDKLKTFIQDYELNSRWSRKMWMQNGDHKAFVDPISGKDVGFTFGDALIDEQRVGKDGIHFHNVMDGIVFFHKDDFPPTSMQNIVLHGGEFARFKFAEIFKKLTGTSKKEENR